jgi:hypothetical protein
MLQALQGVGEATVEALICSVLAPIPKAPKLPAVTFRVPGRETEQLTSNSVAAPTL